MGNQLSSIAPSQILSVDHYFADLNDYDYDIRYIYTVYFSNLVIKMGNTAQHYFTKRSKLQRQVVVVFCALSALQRAVERSQCQIWLKPKNPNVLIEFCNIVIMPQDVILTL